MVCPPARPQEAPHATGSLAGLRGWGGRWCRAPGRSWRAGGRATERRRSGPGALPRASWPAPSRSCACHVPSQRGGAGEYQSAGRAGPGSGLPWPARRAASGPAARRQRVAGRPRQGTASAASPPVRKAIVHGASSGRGIAQVRRTAQRALRAQLGFDKPQGTQRQKGRCSRRTRTRDGQGALRLSRGVFVRTDIEHLQKSLPSIAYRPHDDVGGPAFFR